ncbi:PREDICTED: SHC-transforming protein 2-like [Priapulus caudatus]|uniref:SHC-transforming protein 2-like n=1 Tax=Priapulus caudatus TaxID=37621 RepID=A0ABM1EMH5_PRICU|nr:PREDICTED: SHC-transforming protein 2-like [Priapulus caudatus]
MKSLDFETRTQVAKESITRVCEAARLKTPDKKRKTDKRICKMLGDRPNMQHAGSNINFTVSTDNLSLVIMESGEIIATHQMQGISFASGGDPETLDFVAYVAKDATGRACYVLECGGGLAQDVITTIGQAFELRFKEYLKKAPKPASLVSRAEELLPERPAAWGDDPEYYNDLPGKQPPPLPPLPRSLSQPTRHDDDAAACNHLFTTQVSEAAIPPSRHGAADAFSGAPYTRRACDKQPVLPPEGVPPQPPSRDDSNGCIPLEQEHWFHSTLTRREAEQLVKRDGDFLVRESSQSPGQYVLTGMQGSHVKHLLLVDPEGVVRTKDRVFESVGHLIEYHRQNGLPITSAESSIVLLSPV